MMSFLIAATLAGQPVDIEVPITLSQAKDSWGVQALAHGKASQIDKLTLGITISDLVLEANQKYDKDRAIDGIKICLARPIPKNTWETVTCSETQHLDVVVKRGEPLSKSNLNFTIPIPKRRKIASFYLVFVIQEPVVDNKLVEYYATSEGDPLQELQDEISSQRR